MHTSKQHKIEFGYGVWSFQETKQKFKQEMN